MHSIAIKTPWVPAILSASLFLCASAQAGDREGADGTVILRMCKGADSVKMLSVMCLSYINGYADAAHYYGKGKAAFCLGTDERKQAPGMVVKWIEAHPQALTEPAAEVLQKALSAQFSCKPRK
ncbi:MAG: hypothetical protein GC183_00395 [Thiobacillus sp.]|nr:hypothetical protein [Thiobacillus sp.]